MKNVSWQDHPAFRNMDKRKAVVVQNLLNDVEGKPMDRCVAGIMQATQDLRAQNLSFTPSESQMIIEAIGQQLPSNQRTQFDMVIQMLGNFRK